MADILYTYKNQVYANITNRCDCSCTFCIRTTKDTVGDAKEMWFDKDPSFEQIKAAIDSFDFTGFEELVYCGYGEPTCALDNLIASAKYVKEKLGIKIRLNTNGLGNLYHGKDIIPELAEVIDSVSISLNAPTAEKYMEVTRPQFENAFAGMLDFARESVRKFTHAQLTIVDVLPDAEKEACRNLAEQLGIYLKIRKYSA
jgi:radical SAM enzyme (TIGR04100 family)